jgi:transketolase
VHEAIKAADLLAKDGVKARVIDAYSLKPFDGKTLAAAVAATGGRLVVAEDHWPEGGLGEAALAALADAGAKGVALRHLAVREMPASGKPAELLRAAGIDADGIAKAAKGLL